MSLLSAIDEFEVFSSFQHPSREAIFLYIDAMYNMGSTLISDFQDIEHRKRVAATGAGLDITQPWVQNIMKNADNEVNSLVECYIGEIQNNTTFKMLNTAEEYFAELQHLINSKLTDSKLNIADEKVFTAAKAKGDLMNLSEITAERIKKYREELYPKELGYEKKIGVRKRIRPEDV